MHVEILVVVAQCIVFDEDVVLLRRALICYIPTVRLLGPPLLLPNAYRGRPWQLAELILLLRGRPRDCTRPILYLHLGRSLLSDIRKTEISAILV